MMSPLTAQRKFASHSVCTTVALDTIVYQITTITTIIISGLL